MGIFIVAEIGINHNGDIELCKKLIDIAKESGCNAVKFQKRDIDKVYKKEFLQTFRESPWGKTQKDQKLGLEFSFGEYQIINEYCKKKVSRLISNLYFEKLIICIKSENQYNEILTITKDNFPNNKFKISLVEKFRSNEVEEKKSPSHMFEESYIIIENNE